MGRIRYIIFKESQRCGSLVVEMRLVMGSSLNAAEDSPCRADVVLSPQRCDVEAGRVGCQLGSGFRCLIVVHNIKDVAAFDRQIQRDGGSTGTKNQHRTWVHKPHSFCKNSDNSNRLYAMVHQHIFSIAVIATSMLNIPGTRLDTAGMFVSFHAPRTSIPWISSFGATCNRLSTRHLGGYSVKYHYTDRRHFRYCQHTRFV
ncbi:hypothetical protein TNCV_4972711 [Trichonephila clavipes]|nr:hypothetical protein TNCV_4972711 [Trichonephila clavipes]